MKKRTIPILFTLITIGLVGVFFITQRYFSTKKDTSIRAKVVTPKTSSSAEVETEKWSSAVETEKYETFIPLNSGETLISTLTIDLNNDGYDDEVIVIKKVGSPNLWIVPGIYIVESSDYERLEGIETQITRTRTFTYSGMDMIGDHRNVLIYQGVTDDGFSVMKLYLCKKEVGKFKMNCIGDFFSDGTVFIQQTERSESYELSVAKGDSFSVWVYKSEVSFEETGSKKQSAPNQIQQEYKWDARTEQYELVNEIRVTAGRIAAKELSRIQDGTVETFMDFLNGLWYKTSNTDGSIRYIFFGSESKEVIQLVDDIQEVNDIEDTKLRHNGIYLTTVNADITNLQRRFDVSLINVDEIRVTLRDYVGLTIKETTMWDGVYKKMSIQSSFTDSSKSQELDTFANELKKGKIWTTADQLSSIKFDDYSYTLNTNEITETGIYALQRIGSYNVIQFRSDSGLSFMAPSYSMEFGTKVITEVVKKKEYEKTVTDYDFVKFTPVKVTPTDCFVAEGRGYSFSRNVE